MVSPSLEDRSRDTSGPTNASLVYVSVTVTVYVTATYLLLKGRLQINVRAMRTYVELRIINNIRRREEVESLKKLSILCQLVSVTNGAQVRV